MAVNWTDEQKQVINSRNSSLLVSAAAGSGKTAVLVERIISMISEGDHPLNIDQLLVMTFTNAAAAEMRERIGAAVEKKLREHPLDEHLWLQAALIPQAQIMTIDSFCLNLIRNHYNSLDIDPSFRIGDEGELTLLRGDVMEELLEACYQEENEDFIRFAEQFGAGKSDKAMEDVIVQAWQFSQSHPWPGEWLDECRRQLKQEAEGNLDESPWMKFLLKDTALQMEELTHQLQAALEVCREEGGPAVYEPMLENDLAGLLGIKKAAERGTFEKLYEALQAMEFVRLAAARNKAIDEDKKEYVKECRTQVKKLVEKCRESFGFQSPKEAAEAMAGAAPVVETLLDMVQKFDDFYRKAKRERNVLDFNDLEHLALEVLLEGDSPRQPSAVAKELQRQYEEILVDEYQDSNLVQEMITTCVSGWAKKSKNIFMVGDVKQSIYRFRLARPELFMEKYKKYMLTDSEEQRIDLHKNFRSRSQVLSCANFIFRQIMGEDLGGIAYDEAAALYPGAVFPEGARDEFLSTEVLLVEKDSEELEDLMEGQDARELEALTISHRIQEMVGKEKILDKETGEYRPVRYGDIVILLRTASGWSETFTDVLSAHGIPVYAASKTGYFSALEVVTVLNYLQVCDNPLQDIPLAGVLRSPLAGCTTQELAVIREEDPEGMLYESVLHFLGEEEQCSLISPKEREALQEKLHGFITLLNEMRDLAVYTPVHELILEILRRTGYGNYAKALPNGAQRSANLAMLVEKAMDYEKTSYRGLFNFVRYIEHLQKYEVDYGEVNLSGAGEGSVEIMTIHKSKGLEFPVVILAGMGKQFNFQDLNAKLLIHPDYGLGADAILPDRRMVVSTLNKQVIRRQLLEESLGEEIRVLYVALTRAKEKMILTGAVSNLDKELISLSHFRENQTELLPAETRLKGKNYLDYVLPALARHRCMDSLYEKIGLFPTKENPLYEDPAQFQVKRITAQMLTEAEVVDQATGQMEENLLEDWDCEKVMDSGIREELDKRFGFVYPYEYRRDIPVKVTVSDLKKKSYHEDEEIEEAVYFEPDLVPLVPRFIEEKTEAEEEFTGAARGTAYHRVMECLEYGKTDTSQNLKEQIEELVQNQKLSEVEAKCVRVSDIRGFVECDLGQRMKAAALKGRLFREQPFVISRSAAEIDESWDESERVLVQGIIDAYFLEDEEIVLVDYKTDYVRRGEEKKLIERYHTQLEDYGQALERMTGRRVKEKYIYSFALKKAILL